MTFENKIVVGLGEIKAVTFQCSDTKCEARVSVPPDNVSVPEKCPHCGRQWLGGTVPKQEAPAPASMRLCEALGEIRRRIKDNGASPFEILLEFEAHKP